MVMDERFSRVSSTLLPLCLLTACDKSETAKAEPPAVNAQDASDTLDYVAGEAGTDYDLLVADGSRMHYTIPPKPRASLAFWETGESTLDLTDEQKADKTSGDPTFYITFPIGSTDCFSFEHWKPDGQ